MPKWNEGDRVRVVRRDVTADDRKENRYFEHMAGLVGVVQNVYQNEVAVKIEEDSLSKVTRDVHAEATRRMREKFLSNVSDEQKKQLTKEELEFNPHYVLLVQNGDLEKA